MEDAPLPPGSILLVEDDKDCRETLAEILEAEGYRTTCVVNGRAALDHLRSGSRPQLILLDLMMPVMDGWQFLEARAQDPVVGSIPVVVVTGAGSRGQRGALPDVAAYLQKPVDLATLLGTVAHYCPRKQR